MDTPLSAQLGFDQPDGTAVGLTIIFGLLTAFLAAIAGGVGEYGPATAPPPRS
ncbi:hypothetical protein [Actinophytocola sp. NPDC049390]|uniref:hypothetical protein n=1 Tax=Actinophytocola sp. NPDC049390 TaxID=3363894 RepID=UPI003792F55D